MSEDQTSEEILQCFDEDGNPTEGRPFSIVKAKPNKYWYGLAFVWVLNSKGELLCSKRALNLKTYPGKWQTRFGGHVPENYSFKQTAVKELKEESGIIISENDLFLIETAKKIEEKVFVKRYTILFNEPTINLADTDGEVTEVRWMGMEDYWQEQEQNPDMWCLHCTPEHQKLIRQWLTAKLK